MTGSTLSENESTVIFSRLAPFPRTRSFSRSMNGIENLVEAYSAFCVPLLLRPDNVRPDGSLCKIHRDRLHDPVCLGKDFEDALIVFYILE